MPTNFRATNLVDTSKLNSLTRLNKLSVVLLLVTLVSASFIYWHFHDRFLYGPDEGAYAHVAQRILSGERLHGDIQDVHGGYVNYVNVLSMRVFGEDFLSMRYPLMIMGIIQSFLIFVLFLRGSHHPMLAALASLTIASLSTIQFLNPTANWYALFFYVILLLFLDAPSDVLKKRVEIIGLLLVTLFLFRQLTGVIVTVATVTYLIYRLDDGRDRFALAARSLISVMFIGIATYLWHTSDIVGFFLIGIWPLGILAWLGLNTRLSDSLTLRLVYRLLLGAVIGALPLFLYHLLNESLTDWLYDIFFAASSLIQLDFISVHHYGPMFVLALLNLLTWKSTVAALNGIFWILVLLAPMLLGMASWLFLWCKDKPEIMQSALPFTAPFFAIVSLHYQIPIYLFYTISISLVALLWVSSIWMSRVRTTATIVICLFSIFVGLFFQAGQPLQRGLIGVIEGETENVHRECPSERCSLRIDTQTASTYIKLLAVINDHSKQTDSIFVAPVNPELYFLTSRRNPVRFYNSALGLRNSEDKELTIQILRSSMPALVIYSPKDKYVTPLIHAVIEALLPAYDYVGNIDGFEVYKVRKAV